MPAVSLAAIIVALLGVAALIGGTVIAVLATRSAPDGFEDHDGFHAERSSRLSLE